MCIEPSKLLGYKNLLYKLILIELKMEGVNQPEVGPFAPVYSRERNYRESAAYSKTS